MIGSLCEYDNGKECFLARIERVNRDVYEVQPVSLGDDGRFEAGGSIRRCHKRQTVIVPTPAEIRERAAELRAHPRYGRHSRDGERDGTAGIRVVSTVFLREALGRE